MKKRHKRSIVTGRLQPRVSFVRTVFAVSLLLTQLCIPVFPVFVYADETEATSEPRVESVEPVVDEVSISKPESTDSADTTESVVESSPDSVVVEDTQIETDVTTEDFEVGPIDSDSDEVISEVPRNETQSSGEDSSVQEGSIDEVDAQDDTTTTSNETQASTTELEENVTQEDGVTDESPVQGEEQQEDTSASSTLEDVIVDDVEPQIEESSDELSETTDAVPTEESEIVGTTTASTTDELEHFVVQEELHVAIPDAQYSFSAADCAQVADGSYYCKKNEERPRVFNDRVFSGPDIDGDSEIFLEKDGVVTQITFNLVDDASPYYDARSNTLVWHRLVDARYQIVSLDLESNEETQLTFDSHNNMQPTRSDDTTVWQGWIGNDWEIMLKDDEGVKMITDNTTHDIGPSINGDFIIWQAEKEGGWDVRLYNLRTGFIESIDGTAGASIENPRLVLMYDAKHVNGDIETRGYDFETGSSITLGAVAPTLPEEIPEPEQTGEERALITPNTQLKTKTGDDEAEGEGDSLLPIVEIDDTGTSTATSTDIVIPPFENEEALATSTDSSETELMLDLTEEDTLPTLKESMDDTEEALPYLIVTPFEETLSTLADPQ